MGKRIKTIRRNPWKCPGERDRCGHGTLHEIEIVLEDDSILRFRVEEGCGDYGVDVIYPAVPVHRSHSGVGGQS